jgi:hypothetical protein
MTAISAALVHLLLYGSMPGVGSNGELRMHLSVVLHLEMSAGELELGLATAKALLAQAAIGVDWQVCSALAGVCEALSRPGQMTLRFVARNVSDRPECGALIRDRHGVAALLYIGRHRALVHKVIHSPRGRAHPALAALKAGHVTGLAIAHEVGHALGLKHAERGVMKGWIDVDDLLALRESRLTFTREQAARMQALLADEVGQSAKNVR